MLNLTRPVVSATDELEDASRERYFGHEHVTVIEPARGWRSLDLRELWAYRELLFVLTMRDIKVRYKQTVLGAAWAILQPFMTMVVFTIFFGHLANMPSDGFPYPLFVYSALVPWTFFANAITSSSNSLVGSAHLISKVYFPRLIIPLSAVGVGILDFASRFKHSACHDALLWSGVDLQFTDGSGSIARNHVHRAWRRYLPICFDGFLSGFSLRRAIFGAVVDVCDTCRLSIEYRSHAVAMVALSKPNVGTDRWISRSVSGNRA